jgi:fatty acid desaturase
MPAAALECLVHEASHFNWSRYHRRVNDLLSFVLAAAPTGARIADYRSSHLKHHGRFGTDDDPDRERHKELDLEALPRHSLVAFGGGLPRRFPAYQRGWLSAFGVTPAIAALPFLWAVAFVALPGWWIGGARTAVSAYVAWLLAYLFFLPVIRFVGESSEHIYRQASTVFDATISNLGRLQRVVFHPHGDGYHTVHHMWPGVPPTTGSPPCIAYC